MLGLDMGVGEWRLGPASAWRGDRITISEEQIVGRMRGKEEEGGGTGISM